MSTDSPEPADTSLIELFNQRDGMLTTVLLTDGTQHLVKDIAWGYDIGDEHAHITTNVSPGGEGLPIDFFFSDAISQLSDPVTGEIIPIRPG